ncbi:proto-oncogene tyrosine-protein kinase receptor Ret-like isoform X1 [Mytilus californianus]|uniref:proto-oncogene tyrosine-protein kinase receptor Ret-like isoform X1 n=1 Tax=Mytilus californianus TaxID=6549 RepID=UPI002247C755|nr:proto-oncogene tyrosine-protein kinase receptor Ret-like isoform X1 [Mytilus californianus]
MAQITYSSWLQGIIFLSSLHFLLCGHFCYRQRQYQYGTESCPGCSNTKSYRGINCCDKWEGYTCDIPICNPPCNGGETCYGPDTCRCSNKIVGGVCSGYACFPPCQHGGECYGPNKCSCRPGYAGDFCDVNPSDIIFVVDESGSVGDDNFRVTMEYLANAVNRLPIRYDLLRIGLALFSGSIRKSFKLDDHFSKEHVTDAILKTYFGSGGTDIDGALGYTCKYMFQLTTGDRHYAQNILVLITDGRSSSAYKPGLLICKSKNVTIIGIGIGSNIDVNQLKSLVSKPEYYFDTTYDNLDTTLPKLIKTITDFCPPGCKNGGTCISRGKCQCPGGYAGLLCETKVTCSPECTNNGTCYQTNTCRCPAGYEGVICDIPICNPECKNNGTCYAADKCLCENGYEGGLCEVNLSEMAPVYTETHVNVIAGLSKNLFIAIVASLCLVLFIVVAVFMFLWRTGRLQPAKQRVTAGIRTIRNTIRVRETASGNVNILYGRNRAQMSNNDDDIYFYGAMETQGQDTWTISRQDLSLETELARGRFAIIYLAQYFNHLEVRKVVAKTLKDDQNEDNVIKMKGKINFYGTKIGHHKNILDFIGSVNDDIRGPIMILEYCSKAVLKEFLESVRSNVTVELEERLFRITLGICEGMDYLASKQVVHRRLAARNVLLNDQYAPKITGFGPDPEANQTGDTKKSERIPIKWMAPECMKTTKYANELSDVFSYGIVMWEIFSLGETPYPGVQNTDVSSVVKRGTKMKKPELCDDAFYKIMLKCWHYDPHKRSGFEQIKQELSKLFTEESGDDDYYMYYKTNEV